MDVLEIVLCYWKGRELLILMNVDWDNLFIGLFIWVIDFYLWEF